MSLRHIHIPSMPWGHPPRCPTYDLVTRIQTKLQQSLLSWKAAGGTSSGAPPPGPALLTFTPAPTFTLGRRQSYPERTELAAMQDRLTVQTYRPAGKVSYSFLKPAVVKTPRGGLTTYHGPGQVLFWPVIDLRSPLHKHFTVRDYAALLEQTTIAALYKAYRIIAHTNPESPGVWAAMRRTAMTRSGEDAEVEEEGKKLASMGVHLRRHVTGLGVAVNFRIDQGNNAKKNPWLRIKACGLDSGIIDVNRLMRHDLPLEDAEETFIPTWAAEFAKRLGVANAVNPDAGPLIQTDNWTKWIFDLGLSRTNNDAGYEIARRRKH